MTDKANGAEMEVHMGCQDNTQPETTALGQESWVPSSKQHPGNSGAHPLTCIPTGLAGSPTFAHSRFPSPQPAAVKLSPQLQADTEERWAQVPLLLDSLLHFRSRCQLWKLKCQSKLQSFLQLVTIYTNNHKTT